MAFLGGILGDILKPVTGIIDKAVVDVDKKKELQYKLQELADNTDQRYHDELMAQMDVNKVEAAHPSIFVAGWRPFSGWVGGFGLAYAGIVHPLIVWGASFGGYTGAIPELDTGLLLVVLTGMLGIGAQRSYDKRNGVDTKSIKS